MRKRWFAAAATLASVAGVLASIASAGTDAPRQRVAIELKLLPSQTFAS